MLSARAYSFRQQSKLAISLSWIGGYTNTIALTVCGQVCSHVTGTTTSFGRALTRTAGAPVPAEGSAAPAFFFGYVLLTFIMGACLSALMTEGAERAGRRSKYLYPISIEALLLTLFSCLMIYAMRHPAGSYTPAVLFTMSGVASLAMGLQNATITRISGAVIRTTHLTGVLTDLGLESVQFFNWYRDQIRGHSWSRQRRVLKVSQRHPSAQRLALLASIFGSFLLGVVIGTIVFAHLPSLAMLPPVAFLLWIVLMDYVQPIADVKMLDLLSDPELKLHGILHSLLPASLGIYRLSGSGRHTMERAPNFQAWAAIMPQRWRVIILALAPVLKMDDNAMMDLEQAVGNLGAQGRRLILCGITTPQYKALDHFGLIDKLGSENVCPDLEFAIARGIELTGAGGERGED